MEAWEERKRPIRLEKRFEFNSYDQTRDFLENLGEKCELDKRFPDISFGKKYVNITLRPEEDNDEVKITNNDLKFAKEIDELLD